MALPPVSDRTTMVGLEPASSLCSTGPFANVLSGAFLRTLQEHFSDPSNLAYNGEDMDLITQGGVQLPGLQLQKYVWNPDETKTGIQIQPVWKYNSKDIQRRPAYYVKRNKWQLAPQEAIDYGMTVSASKDGPAVRGQYQTCTIIGSHTIFAVGQSGAGVELLASEAYDLFMSFRSAIREDLKLHKFAVLEIDAAQLVDEHVEAWVVPVVLAYAKAMAWRVDRVAPWLKSVAVDLR